MRRLLALPHPSHEADPSPYGKYIFMVLMSLMGVFLLVNGIRGLRKGETTLTQRFRTLKFRGREVKAAAWAQVGIGVLFLCVSVLVLIFR